jgi:hypothetical protein
VDEGAAFTLADVMGKRVAAAIIAPTVRAVLRSGSRLALIGDVVEAAAPARLPACPGTRVRCTARVRCTVRRSVAGCDPVVGQEQAVWAPNSVEWYGCSGRQRMPGPGPAASVACPGPAQPYHSTVFTPS